MTVLVDSNVPMYLVGARHPRKVDAQRLLEELAVQRRRLVTDAEVFQEILHRYRALDRRDAVQPAFDLLEALVEEVWPVGHTTVTRAKDLLLARPGLSARDAVHVAAMEEHGATEIASFDQDFDAVPGITRLA